MLVTSHGGRSDWEWVKWLPHVRPSSFAEGRLLVAVADDNGELDGGQLDDVAIDAEAGTAVVVVVDAEGLADAGDLAVKRLLRRHARVTAGFVLAASVDQLPDACDVVVELHETQGEATCRWPRQGGPAVEFVVGGTSTVTAEAAARHLARFSDPDAGGGSAALPTRVSQAAVLGLTGATPADVAHRWAHAPLAPTVTVGLGENGPVSADLAAHGPHMMVVGSRGSGKTEQLLTVVFGLASTHSPERLHLLLWGESFAHLHRLPHVASLVNRIDEAAATTVAEGLERELTRRERLRTKAGDQTPREPALVVVIDDVDTLTRLVPRAAEDLVRILRRARGLGVHVVWSSNRITAGVMHDLVDLSTIRMVLRVASAHESTDLLGTDAAALLERSLPGRGYLVTGRSEPREVHGGVVSSGAPAPAAQLEVVPFPLARHVGGSVRLGPPDERALVSLLAGAGATATRPTDLLSSAAAVNVALESPGLLELLGYDEHDPALAVAALRDAWQTVDTDAFLRVPIGVDPELRPILLDLKESALAGMGPHGLMVGATGSGKSELLRTLVTALAATHSPEMLAFVLVDFKGGASFASFGALPHVSGVVTNLADDMALIDRILAALGGEQKRRQELLAQAGNLANVRDYRAKYRDGTLPEHLRTTPMPQLLVIVDEFAELLDQEPAFIDFFLTIGRVGRSLGIHLLLASQRLEEGKLRGLDTYLSYRLGMRTFSASESRTVLGVPDAYSLPQAPGGGYLKVGNTSFERFQASYVSGPATADGPASVMQLIVDRLAAAAPRTHQIWLPPLPTDVPLDRLFGRGGFVEDPERGFTAASWPRVGKLAVPIGVLDEPEQQRQLPLVIDFAGAHGNLAVVGAPQTGKSVLLRSLVLSLAATHTPDEVQVYAVDLGGGTLDVLAGLPHVGTVANRLEPDLVHRLVGHVEGLLGAREALFREHGIDSAATFRAKRAAGELPEGTGGDVVLIIDGWAAFRERFDGLEGAIVDLISRGLGYGIHVVLTGNRWMDIRANVLDPIGGRLELRVNDPIDSAIDRRKAATIRADQAGRGLHPSKRVFQIALPRLDGADRRDHLPAATALAVEHIAERWHGAHAAPIRLLPPRITLAELDLDGRSGAAVPVGLQEAGMRPWWLDLSGTEPHFMVFGDGESGKTTFLRAWLTGLVERTPPSDARIVLVDYRRTLLDVVPAAHLGGYAASEPAAADLAAAVAERIGDRQPGADVTAAQLRARSWWQGPEIYVVVDDYDLVATPGGNPLSALLPFLAQGRDLGLHLITARRVAGASKTLFEPLSARCKELSPYGLVLSGEREEGVLLGNTRATRQPPGRGTLVSRHHPATLVQVVDHP